MGEPEHSGLPVIRTAWRWTLAAGRCARGTDEREIDRKQNGLRRKFLMPDKFTDG